MRQGRISIGNAIFLVDVAETSAEMAQGLIGRPHSPGMFFHFGQPRNSVMMSMFGMDRPLDMVFVGPPRTQRARQPFGRVEDLRTSIPVDRNVPVQGRGIIAVIELPAGMVKERGIERGALVYLQP